MGSTAPRARRGNTRQRIQDVALELFAERGYEKTSLREIAERLDVSKAALYYHFKSKEDIVLSLLQDQGRPLDQLIAWGREQPRTLEVKQELLRRYSTALENIAPLLRFLQDNQAAVRELSVGQIFKDRMFAMADLLRDPQAALRDQVRCMTALFSMHAGMLALQAIEGEPDDKRKAVLEVALDLLAQAHAPKTP